MSEAKFLLCGESAVSVELGDEISEAVNARVRAFALTLERAKIPGIVETVPSYRALMVCYDPLILPYDALISVLEEQLAHSGSYPLPPASVLELPVLYGGELGPDLAFVAQHAGKTEQEVINIHTSRDYLIYMIGFTPGFTYLGGMSEEIATPRLATPRVKIPAGSVGIGDTQTGVYPIDSPGGWRLIGHTPVRLYDSLREKAILPEAGQYIRFRAVDRAEYDAICAEVAAGRYICPCYPKEEVQP